VKWAAKGRPEGAGLWRCVKPREAIPDCPTTREANADAHKQQNMRRDILIGLSGLPSLTQPVSFVESRADRGYVLLMHASERREFSDE